MGYWAAAAGLVLGAISSKQQADAANKKKTSETNQTTTQQGNYANELQPDFRQLMQLNRALMEAGPTYIPGGHVTGQQGWPGGGHAGGPGPAPPTDQNTGGKTYDPKTFPYPQGPTTPSAPGDNQDFPGGPPHNEIDPGGVPTTQDVVPLVGRSSWFPSGGDGARSDGGAGPRELSSSLPEGATRRPDGRVILASGETQGMTKSDRHRAWREWQQARAGMGA